VPLLYRRSTALLAENYFYREMGKLKITPIIAGKGQKLHRNYVENPMCYGTGRKRQIAAVNGRKLQSRDLQIVYNPKRRCRSSSLLSLALDPHS